MDIKIIYSKKHFLHNPPYEIYDGVFAVYAEKPERLTSIVNTLRENGFQSFYNPIQFPISRINKIHQKEYTAFLRKKSGRLKKNEIVYPSYFIMDTYAPIVRSTYSAAKTAVDVALTGAKYVREGERVVYSLCRPPGHHADYKTMGGYCYFNNAAIAADYLSEHGKVAILDIDFHHGNGTQNIFYNRPDVFYVSIHADPHVKYPHSSGFAGERGSGEGAKFNRNYPLPLGVTDNQYLKVLLKALKDVRSFKPKYLILSAGFDTYKNDPIGGFRLTLPFFETIGREIAKLNIPSLIVQEGGYNIDDLGKLALNFLIGFSKK